VRLSLSVEYIYANIEITIDENALHFFSRLRFSEVCDETSWQLRITFKAEKYDKMINMITDV
jgi:hypothetical protein